MGVILQPRVVIVPWDHQGPNRRFTGELMGLPEGFQHPFLGYIKGRDFPPFRLYGRENNSSSAYVADKVAAGIPQERAFQELGISPGVYLKYALPLVSLNMTGNPYCWLSRGLMQYFAEHEITRIQRLRATREPKVDDTLRTADYGASLLLTMALAAGKEGSMATVPQGMERIMNMLIDRAWQFTKGRVTRCDSPESLFLAIAPELGGAGEIKQLEGQMRRIREQILG
ncbi:hypothetical protein FJZ40_04830 [Candidatus Shapirobacteria bacterium]|nr:hypothetical protein [Candidatus Shapirobacteria bacterium]